jgi:hypothetical protein
MTGGIAVGIVSSYLLAQWTRDGGLVKLLPAADWTPWLWVAGLALMALLLASGWYRFGRGICTVLPIGFVVAAATAVQDGHNRLAAPLLAVAFACVAAVGLAMAVEDRVRRPT